MLNNSKQNIGSMITKLRSDKGMTQQLLADRSGVNRVNIAKLEKGTYNASIDVLDKILYVLDAELTITRRTVQ